ncbi:MAG: sulfotransferase [Proteobacteria bacterium]|nr:sulfotransferase [Pseudomonadota bacterium]
MTQTTADFPEWHGPPARTLVLCAHPRSGSTLLAEAIATTGRLGRPLEYFQAGHRPLFEARWKPADLLEYVAILHRRRTAPTGVFAVKLFWRGLVSFAHERATGAPLAADIPEALLPDQGYRDLAAAIADAFPAPMFVHIVRRDFIAQAVSIHRATQSGIWLARAGSNAPGPAPVRYDFARILEYVGRIRRSNAHWQAFFRANRIATYPIVYEDLASDYPGVLAGLFEWLGEPATVFAPPRLRKLADAHSEALAQRFREDFARFSRG